MLVPLYLSEYEGLIFDVREASLEEVYSAYRDVFERNQNYAWPETSYETEAELIALLKTQAVKGFLISSSYGMEGFVLAREMRLV